MSALTRRVNSYLAMLLITLVGAGATMMIVHIANNPEAFIANGETGQVNAFLQDKNP